MVSFFKKLRMFLINTRYLICFLVAYQAPIQIDDIKSILEIDGLDWGYISKWIKQLELCTFDLINR